MKPFALTKRHVVVVLLLSAVMAATRFNHFGSAVSPPDASLAIFFLAGFYLLPRFLFPVLIVEAGLIDYVAITYGGMSNWCVTPAYLFLIPTYATLWFAGRWYAGRHHGSWGTLMPLVFALLVSTSVAFLISNGSFYLLSGYFPKMSPGQYAASVGKYYFPYVGIAFFYVGVAALVHVLVAAMGALRPEPSASHIPKDL